MHSAMDSLGGPLLGGTTYSMTVLASVVVLLTSLPAVEPRLRQNTETESLVGGLRLSAPL